MLLSGGGVEILYVFSPFLKSHVSGVLVTCLGVHCPHILGTLVHWPPWLYLLFGRCFAVFICFNVSSTEASVLPKLPAFFLREARLA